MSPIVYTSLSSKAFGEGLQLQLAAIQVASEADAALLLKDFFSYANRPGCFNTPWLFCTTGNNFSLLGRLTKAEYGRHLTTKQGLFPQAFFK